MDITIPYYEDKTRISNSNIGWFLNKGPAYLHKMLTEDVPEEKNPVLERGTMIHMFILQPEEFQKTYVVWDKPKPSSVQQEKFCQELANTVEIEPDKAVLSAYKAAYSATGKTDKVMLSEGLKIASTLKDYIDFLKLHDGRIMINPWDAKMLEKIKQNIQSHKLANMIINPCFEYKDETLYLNYVKNYHEFHINWEYSFDTFKSNKHTSDNVISVTIKCKSLLDGLTLDFKNKNAIIYDLKTTQKLWHFEDSMEQYDYGRQLAYYKGAVWWYLKNECNEDPNNWHFKYYIIGIDTTGSNEIRVFEIPETLIVDRDKVIFTVMLHIGWHQVNNKWDHSREYYEGDGSETLSL